MPYILDDYEPPEDRRSDYDDDELNDDFCLECGADLDMYGVCVEGCNSGEQPI